jgi:Copper amine oxidase, enzyme domain
MTPAKRRRVRTASGTRKQLGIKIDSFGPTAADIAALAQRLTKHRAVQTMLAKTKHRLLYIDLLDAAADAKVDNPKPPDRFRATFYDYTNNRTVFAIGSLPRAASLEVIESGLQPRPSEEEFEAAVEAVRADPDLGLAIRDGRLVPYQAMPPLVDRELPDGTTERTLAVGLLPREGTRGHEIVGVRIATREVIRFGATERGRAPLTAAAHNPICGLPYAGQATASHVPGSVWITVTQGGATVWKFLAVRPAASSGTNGSGIELKYLDYRGKRVLFRAHVPILNVTYNGNACGPYRDWQNQEGMIQANGTDVAPGFRLCTSPAATILTTGSDIGSYLGVGIYVQGQEVVLVSEMQAGWYRYVSEWRLHTDGTIRPRFGFSAVQNSCVCNVHHHHVYWRLDFDLRSAGNNLVREFNSPPLFGGANWHDKNFEIRRSRDPARQRKWRVVNKSTREAYDIVPGPNDGLAATAPDAPFGRGDVWILRYHGAEIDDGSVATGPPYEAELDRWVNGEAINGADVVVWYGAHFTHDVAHDHPGEFGHVLGPDLKRVRW